MSETIEMQAPILTTERLALRPRTHDDIDAVVALNSDPDVMRYIAPLGSASTGREQVLARSFNHIALGLGYWTVFPRNAGDGFLGYVGLIPDADDAEGVQISYRFGSRHWGRGYALEATSSLLDHGFGKLALPHVHLLTHPDNAASCRLAERLGFTRNTYSSAVLIGDPPVAGASFRMARESWRNRAQTASGRKAR